jgi:phage terminase small subunit
MARTLTKKQKGFVKDYIETGVGITAVKNNYDVSDDNTAYVMASENLSKPKIREAIDRHAKDAVAMIYTLSQHSKQDVVKLNASKDILDRAGFKPVEKTETKTLNVEMKVETDLDTLREEFENKLKDKLLT